MREVFLLLVAAFLSMQEPCMARVVCDESGWNEFGTWSTCLKYHRESGAREGRRPVDASRVGKVEKVHKNLDGSVTGGMVLPILKNGRKLMPTRGSANADCPTFNRERS